MPCGGVLCPDQRHQFPGFHPHLGPSCSSNRPIRAAHRRFTSTGHRVGRAAQEPTGPAPQYPTGGLPSPTPRRNVTNVPPSFARTRPRRPHRAPAHPPEPSSRQGCESSGPLPRVVQKSTADAEGHAAACAFLTLPVPLWAPLASPRRAGPHHIHRPFPIDCRVGDLQRPSPRASPQVKQAQLTLSDRRRRDRRVPPRPDDDPPRWLLARLTGADGDANMVHSCRIRQ